LHITTLIRTFVLLMEKDGGIRPCDVLATCASQGATFYLTQTKLVRKDKRKSTYCPTFRYKLI
jgi:hypothetical protein